MRPAGTPRILPIRWRIILPFALLTTTTSALVGWRAARSVADRVEADVREDLQRVVARLAGSGAALQEAYVPFLATVADARILTFDAAGAVLASSMPPDETASWHLALGREPLEASGDRTVDGEAYLVAAERVPWIGLLRHPAVVAAAVPRRRIVEAQRSAATPVLALVAVQALAALLTGAAVAASLTRPLARLADRARRIAAGDLAPENPAAATRDEIGLLASTLEGMVDSLRQAQAGLVQAERMAVLGRLSAGLAHEIRNPLSSIRMHVQLLGRDPAVPRSTTDLLLGEIDRLEGILSDLLAWAGPARLEKAPVDLAALAEEALRLMAPQLEHRGTRTESELTPLPEISGDRDRLRQVLRNLLTNARDAVGTGGRIRVATRAEPGWVVLEVEDDGPGIPAALEGRLFEPFATGRRDGTGLGLAITRQIVAAHGGTVAAESVPGRTVFRVRLPLS